jgi:arylsulfatase A-like enzyme
MPHTRRFFLKTAAAAGAAAATDALFERSAHAATADRPNLVFFLGEGARWDESSLAGNKLLKTPHIDRIGREGAVFANAFCINSLCLPARATILSGLYSHTTGAVDNQHSKVPTRFPIVTDLFTFPWNPCSPSRGNSVHDRVEYAPEEFELYDLEADPAEMRNLHGDPHHGGLVRQLAARLEELRRETGDHYVYEPTVLATCQSAGEECSNR